MIARIGQACGGPVLFAIGKWGSMASFIMVPVSLVSEVLAARLLSSGWGPHDDSRVGPVTRNNPFRNALSARRRINNAYTFAARIAMVRHFSGPTRRGAISLVKVFSAAPMA